MTMPQLLNQAIEISSTTQRLKLPWQSPKLTKHGDIASLTKQWPGPDGLFPMSDGGYGDT